MPKIASRITRNGSTFFLRQKLPSDLQTSGSNLSFYDKRSQNSELRHGVMGIDLFKKFAFC